MPGNRLYRWVSSPDLLAKAKAAAGAFEPGTYAKSRSDVLSATPANLEVARGQILLEEPESSGTRAGLIGVFSASARRAIGKPDCLFESYQ
jgi:hypothetical protein